MSEAIMNTFNTVQYCIDNIIPCFTFNLDYRKIIGKSGWNKITHDVKDHIDLSQNGFAVLTGHTYIMIDIDFKHDVPNDITILLQTNCSAYERTPGGYHFYFLADERSRTLVNAAKRYWNDVQYNGIDFRTKGGLSICDPSYYTAIDGSMKHYRWEHGNLSTASYLPDIVWQAVNHPENIRHTPHTTTIEDAPELTEGQWRDIQELVAMLSVERATSYDSWRNVIFSLRNTEKSIRMLELCHTFSKTSTSYDARSVNRKFYGSRPSYDPLTIKSLYYWAKLDSPDKYITFRSKDNKIVNAIFLGTNASVAELFYELNPNRYLYSSAEGWYVLETNNVWKATDSHEVKCIPNILNAIRDDCKQMIYKMLDNQKDYKIHSKTIEETMKRISTASFIKGVTEFLKGMYYQKDVELKFNQNRDLLAFENGILNLKTFQFRETAPDDYITITTKYDYRPIRDEEKQKASQLIQKIFPQITVYDYMLKALGTCLTGYNYSECFHILTGTGANGKSLLMDLCKKVLGDYYKTITVGYLTKEDNGKDSALPELVATRFARMLIASEPEARDRFQISFMKKITGNDEISCRGLYKSTVRFVAQFKLWILANDVPKFSKYDRGIERRTRCVHFPTRFVQHPKGENEKEIDETLKSKIDNDESWKYGLLGLLIDALQSLQGKPLEMPEEVIRFTEKYLLENNPVGSWLKTYYDKTGNREDIVQRTELYKQFQEDTGTHCTQKSFSEDMVKCDVNTKVLDGKYYYYGIKRKGSINEEE